MVNNVRTERSCMEHRKTSKIAGISLTALLALTGCSGDNDETVIDEPNGNSGTQEETDAEDPNDEETQEQIGDEHVFEFEQAKDQRGGGQGHEPHHPSPGEPVIVQLSDELEALAPEDSPMVVQSYTINPKTLGNNACRLNIEIEYTDGGLEAMLEEEGVDPSADPEEPHAPGTRFGFPLPMWLTDTMDGQIVDALPSDEEVIGTEAPVSNVGSAQVYFTDDYSAMSFVDECNADETESFIRLQFPGLNDGTGGTPFAQVTLSVLDDESVILSHSTIRGVQADSNGDWERVN